MEKQELRRLLKEKRAALSEEQKKEFDRAIVQNIAATEAFQNASAVLLYAPTRGEINLLPLARIARRMGKPIAFPRCDKEQNTMEFYLLTEQARLTPGAYGIPEPPADAPLCRPDERALCVLPGLSFDPMGNRLGYGKGYYDRYLADFPGVTVGALYAQMMLRRIPADPHDMAAELLVTERGSFSALPHQLPPRAKAENSPASDAPDSPVKTVQTAAKKLFARVQGPLRERLQHNEKEAPAAQNAQAVRKTAPLHVPPLLVLCTFLLLWLSRIIDTQFFNRDNEYLGVILLQLLIFILPAILYCKLRGERFGERIRIHPPRIEHILFIFFILVIMITGGLLFSILTGGIEALDGSFTLYSTFVARTDGTAEILYAILAYALLPAIGEELIYRSILCAEYEKYGVAVSVTVSALFFAMLHFSFQHFLTYLFLGALLALSMYTTRSFFVPLLLHLCYNVFCLFGQPYLSAFYVNAGSTEIFVFCLVVLFLLFAAFAAGEARKIYHVYAKRNADASYTSPLPLREYPKALLFSLLTPSAAVCLLVFLLSAAAALL